MEVRQECLSIALICDVRLIHGSTQSQGGEDKLIKSEGDLEAPAIVSLSESKW